MRNAKLEAKLIRRSIREDNRARMLLGSIHSSTMSACRDPYLVKETPWKGWGIVLGLVVVMGLLLLMVL